jgi:hypothetical protein
MVASAVAEMQTVTVQQIQERLAHQVPMELVVVVVVVELIITQEQAALELLLSNM